MEVEMCFVMIPMASSCIMNYMKKHTNLLPSDLEEMMIETRENYALEVQSAAVNDTFFKAYPTKIHTYVHKEDKPFSQLMNLVLNSIKGVDEYVFYHDKK